MRKLHIQGSHHQNTTMVERHGILRSEYSRKYYLQDFSKGRSSMSFAPGGSNVLAYYRLNAIVRCRSRRGCLYTHSTPQVPSWCQWLIDILIAP